MKLASVLALLATNAVACSVPVFRYALEHWAADAYQVEIAHRDPLTEAEQRLVQQLRNSKLSNIAIKDITSQDAVARMVVKHPTALNGGREIFSGTLTNDNVKAMLDSPMRQEIATKLGEGDSAVWVLLESGDKAKDDAVAALLDRELNRLGETMELPKLDDQDIKNGLVSVPDEGLRLSFSVLRLARDNAAEQFLVQTLLATEPDLKEIREPMVFPIFGRGRVLYALVGKGIRADNLGAAARFLIGSCSCQIKEQNPGVDLVLSADWKKLLKTNKLLDEQLPTLSDIEGLKPILVPIPERSHPSNASSGDVSGTLALAALLMIAVLAQLWRSSAAGA